jgi:dihydrofolate synthase/folylpolyglutamate synthase
MLGQYQVFNASHVLLCIYALSELGVHIDEAAVREGLNRAVWPGRMEIINLDPLCLVDGAHNKDGAEAFCRSVEPFRCGKRHIVVAGMLKTKDFAGFMELVSQTADLLIVTQPNSNNALPAGKAASAIIDKPLIVEPDCRKAFDMALLMAGSDIVISIVGSLYLVSDLRKYFAEVKNDRLQGGNSKI